MSKIFITGGSSFIAQTILPELEKQYSIYAPNYKQLDIKNQFDLFEVFKNNKFEVVIHTASKGGRRTSDNNPQDLYDNLLMLKNLLYFQDKYKFKLILFSSGAEYDLRGNIFNVKENQFTSIPIDSYGLFKYIQTNLIKNKENIVNLRLFNVFSELGQKDSFIYSTINKCLKNEDIDIFEDKFFSFFYGQDLVKVVNYSINKFTNYTELNCVYCSTWKLSDVANHIKALTNSKSNIIIRKDIGKAYHASGDKLFYCNLQLDGYEKGIKNCVKYQNENKH